MSELITIDEAAARHKVSSKVLRGRLYLQSLAGDRDLHLPIGCAVEGYVYDDYRLQRWAARQRRS